MWILLHANPRDNGSLISKTGKYSKKHVAEMIVDQVRESFAIIPRKSIRQASRELQIPRSTVHKILRKRICMRAYKLQLLHQPKPDDCRKRVNFCDEMIRRIDENPSKYFNTLHHGRNQEEEGCYNFEHFQNRITLLGLESWRLDSKLSSLKKMAELAIESLESNLQLTWLRTREELFYIKCRESLKSYIVHLYGEEMHRSIHKFEQLCKKRVTSSLKKMAELAVESLESNLQLNWLRTREELFYIKRWESLKSYIFKMFEK
ncbi:hypothetical protein ANN_04700 [Periplaneta americana]|uniref:Uncharacterized protein n=1 Tax=Periplaneta americana TaxID=6978 RepID=A0ABQ8T947_PERAM|nr:hypothetical protein ANN_04700 [Periplaneta americana]